MIQVPVYYYFELCGKKYTLFLYFIMAYCLSKCERTDSKRGSYTIFVLHISVSDPDSISLVDPDPDPRCSLLRAEGFSCS